MESSEQFQAKSIDSSVAFPAATVATAPATTGIATATATATAVATGAAIANATATASTAEFYGPGLLHMTLKGNASMICSKPQRC